MSPQLVGQLVRFATVGLSNTALTLATYTALTAIGVPAPPAAAVSFAAGAVNGYRLNRAWTFASGLRGVGPAGRYVAVQALGASLDALGVAAAVGHEHLARLAAEIVILPPVTLVTFMLCRHWVFVRRAHA